MHLGMMGSIPAPSFESFEVWNLGLELGEVLSSNGKVVLHIM